MFTHRNTEMRLISETELKHPGVDLSHRIVVYVRCVESTSQRDAAGDGKRSLVFRFTW